MAGRKAKKYRHFLSPQWHKEKENYKYNLVGNLYTIVDVLKNELDEKNYVIRSLLLKLVKDIAVLVNNSDRKGSVHDDDSVVESLVSLNNALGSIVDDVNGYCDKTVNVYQSLNHSIENLVDKGNRSESCESKESDDGDEKDEIILENTKFVVKGENSFVGGESTHKTAVKSDNYDANEVDQVYDKKAKIIEPKIQRTFVSECYGKNYDSQVKEEESTNIEVKSETENNAENDDKEDKIRTENNKHKDDGNESIKRQNDEEVNKGEAKNEDVQVNDLNAGESPQNEKDECHEYQLDVNKINENYFDINDKSEGKPVDYGNRLFAEALIQSLHRIADELSTYLDEYSKGDEEAENGSVKDENDFDNVRGSKDEDDESVNSEKEKDDIELNKKEELDEEVDNEESNESESDSNDEVSIDIKTELRCTYCMEYDNPKTKSMGVIEDVQVDDKNKSEKVIQCQYCKRDKTGTGDENSSISDDEISDVSVSNGDEVESREDTYFNSEIKDEDSGTQESDKDTESNVNITNSTAGEENQMVGENEEECKIDGEYNEINDGYDECKSNETCEKSEEGKYQTMKVENDEENAHEAFCTTDKVNESEIDTEDICNETEKDSISDKSEYDQNNNSSETQWNQSMEEKLVVLLTDILAEHTKCQFSDEETNCEVEKNASCTDDEKTDDNCNVLFEEEESKTNENEPSKNDTNEENVNVEIVTNDGNDNTENKCKDEPIEEGKCEMSGKDAMENDNNDDVNAKIVNNDSSCKNEHENEDEAERKESESTRNNANEEDFTIEENNRTDSLCNDKQEDEQEPSTNNEDDKNTEEIKDGEKAVGNDENYRNEEEKEEDKNTDNKNDNNNDNECEKKDEIVSENTKFVVKEENSFVGDESSHKTVVKTDNYDANEVDQVYDKKAKIIEPKIQRTFVSECYGENYDSHDKEEESTNIEVKSETENNDEQKSNNENDEKEIKDGEKAVGNDENYGNEEEKEEDKNTGNENDKNNDDECENNAKNTNNKNENDRVDTSDNQENNGKNKKEEMCEIDESSTAEETKDVDEESDKSEQRETETETLFSLNHENIEAGKNMKMIDGAKIEANDAIETLSTNSSIKGYEINKISRTNSIASSACDNCHPDEGEIDTQLVIEASDSTDEDEEECSAIIQNLNFTYSDRNLTTEEQIWEYREKQDFTYKSKLEAQKKFPFDTIFIASDCILKGLDTENFSERFNVVLRQFGGINVEDMFSQIEPFLDMEPDYLILHVGTHNTMQNSSVQILEGITNLKQDIETYLPSCMVIVSQPVLRLDNRKSAFTILNLNEKLNNDEIDCVVDNTNIQPEHLKEDGVHLNDLGLELITSNLAELIEDL